MSATAKVKADCVFCRVNGLLKGKVAYDNGRAFLLASAFDEGIYLIIPNEHYEEFTDLPDTWWSDVKQLLKKVPNLPKNYNISVNYGPVSGQTQRHLHFWVIPRYEGQPASGKGFARLIREANEGSGA